MVTPLTPLRPFQRQFVKAATATDVDTAALSLPRGNGKSFLAADLLRRGLTPGDPLHVDGRNTCCAPDHWSKRACAIGSFGQTLSRPDIIGTRGTLQKPAHRGQLNTAC